MGTGESGVAGRLAGREEKLSLGREDGWSMEGGREGGEQIDAANPCHLAITRRCGFAPENTADPPLPALLHMPLLTLPLMMFVWARYLNAS